jgi:endoglycosylceramidase
MPGWYPAALLLTARGAARLTLPALVLLIGPLLALTAPSNAAAHGDASGGYFRQVGRWITYPDGRVFDPHGLDSFSTLAPYYPALLARDDARLMADEGFTSLRVGVEPVALEPRIDAYDPAYLRRFSALDSLLGQYGIGTYITLNQDGYNARCGPWTDGFPNWMVLPRTASESLTGPQCEEAWQRFFANARAGDGVGLRDHVLSMWRYAAGVFGGERNIIGYDLLNEPGSGSSALPDNKSVVEPLMVKLLGAVRSADQHHLTFAEPNVGADVLAPNQPHQPFAYSRAELGVTGYTTHDYCNTLAPSPSALAPCIQAEVKGLADTAAAASKQGFAYFLGEFGASDELTQQAAIVDAADRMFVPWNDYAYNAMYDGSGPATQRLLIDESKPASEANAKQAKLDALVVPYAMAVAGTPLSWSYDRGTARVHFLYSTQRAGGGRFPRQAATVIFVPRRKYPHGYIVSADGAQVISSSDSPWLELYADPGQRSVELTISRAAHRHTLTPLEVHRCGYNLRPCG